jgi:3-oxoacyl-[acyl-carrier-protein] synthase-3
VDDVSPASPPAPALIATGSALPEQIRTNEDPVFDWLRDNPQYGAPLFTGYNQRRVLGPGETITSIMVAAGRAALVQGAIGPGEIDMLLGYGSVGQYITPNTLAEVHGELGLPASTEVLPLANDFTNWGSAVVIADALIRVGRIKRALIVCGANWTEYVSYHTPQSVSAGDGAGATVVGPASSPAQWQLVDRQQLTASQDFGGMFVAPDPVGSDSFSSPYIHITAAGMKDFVSFGEVAAPTTVQTLLQRNSLQPSQCTMLCHQTSLSIIQAWQTTLPGMTILHTLPTYGNLEIAAIPVNLDQLGSQIKTDYLVTLGLGVQLHAGALLFTRASAT